MAINPLNRRHADPIADSCQRLVNRSANIEVWGSLQSSIFDRRHPPHLDLSMIYYEDDLSSASAFSGPQASGQSIKSRFGAGCSFAYTAEHRADPELPRIEHFLDLLPMPGAGPVQVFLHGLFLPPLLVVAQVDDRWKSPLLQRQIG